MVTTLTILPPVPDHVPSALVRDIRLFTVPGRHPDPFSAAAALHEDIPVFYMPIGATPGRGAWCVTRAEDARYVLQNPQIFSSANMTGFSQFAGEDWPLIPLELDPPEHTKYRALMNRLLSLPAVNAMADDVRARAVELIDPVAERGNCEFMAAFGRPFPVTIFMELMGLPQAEMPVFLKWEDELLHGLDLPCRMNAAREIAQYLRTLIAERRKRPVADLISLAVGMEVDDRGLTDDEIMGICFLLFIGGLDTVASSLGFYFQHMATHPEIQEYLRRAPERIPYVINEYLRAYSVVTTQRSVTQDTELAGIALRKGDWVMINYGTVSLDPTECPRPREVELDRKANHRHFAFGFGPHFCFGMHLARRELSVALEEWTQRIPTFRLDPAHEVEIHNGNLFGVDRLHLLW